jgi:hypothetical protein
MKILINPAMYNHIKSPYPIFVITYFVRLFNKVRCFVYQIETHEQFLHPGGEEFMTIPCMNDDDEWCGVVANWIGDWSK